MHRRPFIETAAAGALTLGMPGTLWPTAPASDLRTLARPGLLAVLAVPRVRALFSLLPS
jgi:hypothetical protein